MKLTKQQLKQIIKEELKIIKETGGSWGPERYDPNEPSNTPDAIAKDEFTSELMDEVMVMIKEKISDERQWHDVYGKIEWKVVGLLDGATAVESRDRRDELIAVAAAMIEERAPAPLAFEDEWGTP